MIKYLQALLGKLGEFQIRHFFIVILFILILTSVAIVGVTKVTFESDFDEMNPEDLPIMKLDDRIKSKFSSFSAFVVLVQLDDTVDLDDQITDIRDPRVIEFVSRLERNLQKESKVQSVQSVAALFPFGVPDDLATTKLIISNIPQSKFLFNKAASLTLVLIEADVGGDEEKITALNERIQNIIDASGRPGGIKTQVTGEPPLIAIIFNFIISDSLYTLIAALIFIFILVFIIEKSIAKSVVIMTPLVFGLTWTIGTLGWFDVPITIATAGLSAMLLGLGVEYSIFLFSRFDEEKEHHTVPIAIQRALSTTGASTVSSGLTTIIGFSALTLSIFPMLGDLGFSLAIGIAFILLSTMIVLPIVIIIEDKLLAHKRQARVKKESKFGIAFGWYGGFVSRRPFMVIILAVIVTCFMFVGMQSINNQSINFDNVLPEDLPELVSFNVITDEFGDTASASIYIELDPSTVGTDEPADIRDPRVIGYIDVLSQKARNLPYAVEVSSISEFEKQINNGIIPNTLREQKELLEGNHVSSYITDDYTSAIIRVSIDEDGFWNHNIEIANQVDKIILETERPAGLFVAGGGGIIIEKKLNEQLNPDSMKTAIIACIGIIILLLILSRSIKYTILPLITVILAVLWVLGLLGFFQIPFNNITSSVLSMTIGIGIDFGLQLSMRFKQELQRYEKRKAMRETLKNTLYPMVITAIAAVIGFRAMALGKLNIMEDLGNTMSISIISSLIVAVTIVAGLIVLLERKKDLKIGVSKHKHATTH